MNIKKILMGGAVSAIILGSMFSPVLGAGKAPPKATGGVGYDAYGLERHAEFNAIATSNTCSYVDVTDTYVIAFKLDPDTVTTYPHDAFLTQTGTSVSGHGGYLAGAPPYSYEWLIDSGTVTGNAISLTMHYTVGAIGTTMHMSGTIAPDGTLSGIWDDNFGGIRTGTWASTSGSAAVAVTGCTGKGVFNYSDVNGAFYAVDVKYVSVSGDDAWFAGPVVSGNILVGSWIFVEVNDGGEPGIGVDQAWGSVVTEAVAKAGVASMSDPGDGPFAITSGNLQVH